MNTLIGALLVVLVVLLAAIYLYVYQPLQRRESPRAAAPAPDTSSARPRKARKPRRTRAQIDGAQKGQAEALRVRFSQAFERDRERALYAGSTSYIWRSSEDGDVCSTCAKKNKKRFSWTEAPSGGHPGTGCVCDVGYCRCFVEPVFPRD